MYPFAHEAATGCEHLPAFFLSAARSLYLQKHPRTNRGHPTVYGAPRRIARRERPRDGIEKNAAMAASLPVSFGAGTMERSRIESWSPPTTIRYARRQPRRLQWKSLLSNGSVSKLTD
jgi:hypothetical protein